VEPCDDLPPIAIRADDLRQVLLNLMVNAIDAVAARMERDGLPNADGLEVRVRTRETADCVIIEVHDDGPGIPPEVEQRIFEPYFTTKAKGNGLGLYVSQELLQQAHGRLEVEPGREGVGACFRIVVPRAPRPVRAREDEAR